MFLKQHENLDDVDVARVPVMFAHLSFSLTNMELFENIKELHEFTQITQTSSSVVNSCALF